MKKILASLLAAYTLTNAQGPVEPANPAVPEPPIVEPPPVVEPPATNNPPVIVEPPVVEPPITEPLPPVDPLPPIQVPQISQPPPDPVVITPTPTTPSPTTGAPTTAAPTMNPYCPMPAALANNHGVRTGTFSNANQGCILPTDIARDFNGILSCSTFACCQCAAITCGDPYGMPCDKLTISDSGAVGNQNIYVLGDATSAGNINNMFGIGGAFNNGAQIHCGGLESCKASNILGKYVGQVKCSGDMGCSGANIRLEDPGQELQFQCNGMMSCMNTNLEIIITANSQITELQTVEFNGQNAAQGMTVLIDNQGNNPVLLQNLECMSPNACPGIYIEIRGRVFIENCDLQHMNINTVSPSLLAACQAGSNYQPGGFTPQQPQQYPQYPQVQPPQTPQFPPQTQQPPANPGQGTFNPPPPPPAPVTPHGQQPQYPINPYNPHNPMVTNPAILSCEFGQCANRALTISPPNNFQLYCTTAGQCDGLQLTLNAGPDVFGNTGITTITSLTFSAPTRGATININGIDNQIVDVKEIKCAVYGACNGLTIWTGPGVDSWKINMDCQQPGACSGCTMNGVNCEMISVQQGNNLNSFGYPMYVYGGSGPNGGSSVPLSQYPQYTPYQQPQYPPPISQALARPQVSPGVPNSPYPQIPGSLQQAQWR